MLRLQTKHILAAFPKVDQAAAKGLIHFRPPGTMCHKRRRRLIRRYFRGIGRLHRLRFL